MKRLLIHGKETLQKYCADDAGQALILAAILLPVMMLMLGAAVEGGSVMVQYRRMQTAADISALTGAQKLPCSFSDTTCAGSATQDACTYAQSNGFGSGVCNTAASDGSLVTASAPPAVCSPYNFIDYGNKSSNAQCTNGTAGNQNAYIEVNVSKPFQIPIFNVGITLKTHAVAREGVGNLGGFAIYSLNHSASCCGSALSTVGSAYANASFTAGTACDGGFYGAGTVGEVVTDTTGSAYYAPPSNGVTGNCAGTADVTPVGSGAMPTLPDPFASSQPPSGPFPNCAACSQPGLQTDGSGNWTSGGDISGSRSGEEAFPGTYGNMSMCNKCIIYLNPGIYTFTGSTFRTEHGKICIYGSPTCGDNGYCSGGGATGVVLAGTSVADAYMYQCTPWGYWDPRALTGRTLYPNICVTCAPTFYNEATGTSSTVQLNGVVLYMNPSTTITLHGNGGGQNNYGMYMAAPNPCPGTGTFSASSSTVTFPSGASSDPTGSNPSYYTYSAGAVGYDAYANHRSPNSANIYFYPSMDYSVAADCGGSLMDYKDEFGVGVTQGEHLHFLFWNRGGGGVTCAGGDAPSWWGIVYVPGGTVDTRGNCGSRSNLPWVTGQIVADQYSTGGASNLTVYYRPCLSGAICGTGPGTELIQ